MKNLKNLQTIFKTNISLIKDLHSLEFSHSIISYFVHMQYIYNVNKDNSKDLFTTFAIQRNLCKYFLYYHQYFIL